MSFRDYGLKGVVISMFIISITTYTKLHSDNNLYLLLSFICAVSVLINFRTKSDFTDNTICFFFFMGFWFHPTYMILTGEIDAYGVNNYFNSDTLIISIFVFTIWSNFFYYIKVINNIFFYSSNIINIIKKYFYMI